VMRGITLLEPWASLMAMGYKHFETRSWSTEYRGDVVIHASAGKKACRHSYEVEKKFRDAGMEFPEGWPVKPEEYPLGRILAVGRLIDVAEMDEAMVNRQSRMELAFGDWRPGRFVWVIAGLRRVEQLPWKGALGLWKVPPELEAKLAA
jgi:hypothetical protein